MQIALREWNLDLRAAQRRLDSPQVFGKHPSGRPDAGFPHPDQQFEIQRAFAETHQPHLRRVSRIFDGVLD